MMKSDAMMKKDHMMASEDKMMSKDSMMMEDKAMMTDMTPVNCPAGTKGQADGTCMLLEGNTLPRS